MAIAAGPALDLKMRGGFARAMRIIGGEFRSRRLLAPKDALTTRPIPDRVKESLFSLLRGHTEGASVFDGFAGTGAIGLEAVSRGAAPCVFVERDRRVAELLRQNVENLGAADRCDVVVGDALGPGALARCPRPVNLVFLDPPYPLVREALGWRRVRAQFERLIDLLADDGFAVLRTPWPHKVMIAADMPEAVEPSARRGAQDKAGKGRRRQESWEDQWRMQGEDRRRARKGAPADDEEVDENVEVAAEDEDGESPAPSTPADLAFENAEGPETHIYHNMAVHLYAKKKTPR